MPITKSAIKKERVDKRRTLQNLAARGRVRTTVKEARETPSVDTLKNMFSALDRAVKHNLVAKRRAARLKSRISKTLKK